MHKQAIELSRTGNINLSQELVAKLIQVVEGNTGIDATEHKLKMYFEFGISVKGEIDVDSFVELLKKTNELSPIQKYEKIQNIRKSIARAELKLNSIGEESEKTKEENKIHTMSKLLAVLNEWTKKLKEEKKDLSLIAIYHGQC